MGIPKKTIITLLASVSLLVNPVQVNPTIAQQKQNLESILDSRIDNEYDNDTFLVNYSKMSISRLLESVFQLESIIQLKYKTESSYFTLQTRNSGAATAINESTILEWALDKGEKYKYDKKILETRLNDIESGKTKGRQFIYTVSHIINAFDPDESNVSLPPSAQLDKTIVSPYLIYKNKIVKLRVVASNNNLDVALLETQDKDIVLPSFPYKLGNSDKLKVPNLLYIMGNPNMLGIDLGMGSVSKTYSPIIGIGENKNDLFSIKYGLNFGDSGGPVIAILDGNFELVGINEAKIGEAEMMGIAIKINPHINFIVKELYFKK